MEAGSNSGTKPEGKAEYGIRKVCRKALAAFSCLTAFPSEPNTVLPLYACGRFYKTGGTVQ